MPGLVGSRSLRSVRSGARGSESESESASAWAPEEEEAWAARKASSLGWREARMDRMEEIWVAMNSAVVGRGCRDAGVDVERKERGGRGGFGLVGGVVVDAVVVVDAESVRARATLSFEMSAPFEAASVLRVWFR